MSFRLASVCSRFTVLALVAFGTVVPSVARAANTTEAFDFTIHQPYSHIRALGMGNAFTAVADDYAAIYYNPAGLARLPEWQMNFELRGMIDQNFLDITEDIDDATKTNDVSQINDMLQENYGKHISSRVPTVGWHWVWPRWGISIVPADLSLDVEIINAGTPAANVIGTQDTTIAFAYGRNVKWFTKHKLSWGVTLKSIYRAYFNRTLYGLDLAFDKEFIKPEYADEGFTVDGDIGMLFTPEISSRGLLSFFRVLKPTFGLTVRNVADYGFTSNFHVIHKNSGQPPRLQRRLDVGTMWELPNWWIFKSRFAFDIRDIGHDQWTFMKGTHAGVEFLWKLYGWWQGGWRAGINQGYWTAGFTGKLGVFQLDLASYGEEVGSSETKKESRRYMVKTSLDF